MAKAGIKRSSVGSEQLANPRKSKHVLLAQWESNTSGSPESGRILVAGFLGHGFQVTAVMGHDGPFVDVYRKMGIEVHVISQKHWLQRSSIRSYVKTLAVNVFAFWRFLLLIRRIRPSLVYINTVVGPEAAAAARLNRVPVIWHLRDMFEDAGGDMKGLPLFGKWGVRKTIMSLASHVICVSRAVQRNVLGSSTADRVSVIFNGVDEEYFADQQSASREHSSMRIGVPGTLRPMKGQDFMLRALAVAAENLPPFHVRITGESIDAAYRNSLEQLANAERLKGHVNFVGNVRDMPGFLRSCDVLIVPSSCDPLPRTVMESMASGRPLVATRVGGIPEMVDHEVNGLLVEYDDEKGLAAAVERLASDPSLRKSLANAAREKASSHFTIKEYQNKISTIMVSLLKGEQ